MRRYHKERVKENILREEIAAICLPFVKLSRFVTDCWVNTLKGKDINLLVQS